ncbi:MAG TPA: HAMP domain-containing sensor histidine kinase [Beijerinckiaceae bacterium]|jgi:signal transduction histidine kinase
MPRWLVRRVRNVPIRWRILAIAVLNSALAVFLLVRIMDGAQVVRDAWSELRQVRQSERLLASLDSEAGRLQSLIHRYFNQPDASVLAEIIRRREALISSLRVQATIDPVVNQVSRELIGITERFVTGFDDLRAVRSAVSRTYEADVLLPIREMVRLHASLDAATRGSETLEPALAKLRDAFNSMLLAANSYYLSNASEAGEEARRNADEVQRTAAAMLALDLPATQRETVPALQGRAAALRKGLDLLSEQFAEQEALLRDAIDGNAAAMAASIDHVTEAIRHREASAQERFDRVLSDLNMRILIVAAIFVLVVMLISIGVAKSIREPLQELGAAMRAIIGGDYARPVKGLTARDEIGEMARAVEIFRENAIAKRRAEEALLASKEEAEAALTELRTTQTSLIEAEKLAALGSLVAGVAHEVNNPVGISLTVASSLARRCEEFAREIEAGPIRRARLAEFVEGNRDAASQLVSNLHRAGELVQSFKQVAVDRSHADRRLFDLRESTDQIIASLRPGLKKNQVRLVVDVPAGIVMDSYPGMFGQVLTNLFLNSGYHAFPGDLTGTISVVARTSGSDQVHIIFRDDGIGMPEEVQRHAFDPFFTTRRGEGGTGLGLHIVYTLITRKLGGRIVLSSEPGKGTTFRISLPRVSPAEEAGAPAVMTVEG